MPNKNESFDVTFKVFVTNNYTNITGSINGFLGIGPCPNGLINGGYSFASKLIDYYKEHGFIAEEDKYFKSIEWLTNSPWNNTGYDNDINGIIRFNEPHINEHADNYLKLGKSILTFKYYDDIVYD